MSKSFKCLIWVTIFLTPGAASYAQDEPAVLAIWYNALAPVDRTVISELLSDDAIIELQDIEIAQSKEEFIDSLDAWETAIEGGSISYRFDAGASHEMRKVVANVCYKFPSNEMMTREVFTLKNGQIKESVQSTLSEECKGF